MRWFNIDRVIALNIVLLSLDSMAYLLVLHGFNHVGAYRMVSTVLHLVLLFAIPFAPRARLAPAVAHPVVLKRQDQDFLDGNIPENDLSDVERQVLAVRRTHIHAGLAA